MFNVAGGDLAQLLCSSLSLLSLLIFFLIDELITCSTLNRSKLSGEC